MFDKVISSRKKKLSFGQRAADKICRIAGSWTFIIFFCLFIIAWALLNTFIVFFGVWDVYPFILLNLFLSCLAALQAPIILMSQNRQADIDRQKVNYDYLIDRKSERGIKQLQLDVLEIKQVVLKQLTKSQTDKLRNELKSLRLEIEKMESNKNNGKK